MVTAIVEVEDVPSEVVADAAAIDPVHEAEAVEDVHAGLPATGPCQGRDPEVEEDSREEVLDLDQGLSEGGRMLILDHAKLKNILQLFLFIVLYIFLTFICFGEDYEKNKKALSLWFESHIE